MKRMVWRFGMSAVETKPAVHVVPHLLCWQMQAASRGNPVLPSQPE
jgi:hypothetical protein